MKEMGRLALLAVVAGWLLHTFATTRMYGAGDAVWYEHMLADYVLQLRAGVLPVFVGQTAYAFNGAVYPLRVAPLYQHLAGLIDLLTARSMGFVSLQHATVIFCGVCGIFGSYLTLCSLAPSRRWTAAALAVLYISCPGLLATIYTQDLYMTWMTVPLAPLVVYGIARTFRTDDLASQVWLVAPLAALWWAHAPIALWFTFIVAISQVVRLCRIGVSAGIVGRAIIGAALFAALAQYPFISVASITARGHPVTVVGTLAHPEKVIEFIRGTFPGSVLPLSPRAGSLSDMQLGYGLWLVLVLAAIAAFRIRSAEIALFVVSSCCLLVLVIPFGSVTTFLWEHLPSAVIRITYYWPMQRFYLIIAALLVVSGQLALSLGHSSRAARATTAAILGLSCAWSLWESRQFIRAAPARTASLETTNRAMRPENLVLMDHAYGLFPGLPPTFSNGAMDPTSEFRFLSRLNGEPLAPRGQVASEGTLVGTLDANPGILDLSPAMKLEAGRRYRLELRPRRSDMEGILQISGRDLFREYSLPSSGEAKAFGFAAGNRRDITLWSSNPAGDEVRLRFIPQNGTPASAFSDFGTFALREDSQRLNITSLVPLALTGYAPEPVNLESPRVYMPGYRSTVDGVPAPVTSSAAGLATVALEKEGRHEVRLWFQAPVKLELSYWTALLCWLAVLTYAVAGLLKTKSSAAPAR